MYVSHWARAAAVGGVAAASVLRALCAAIGESVGVVAMSVREFNWRAARRRSSAVHGRRRQCDCGGCGADGDNARICGRHLCSVVRARCLRYAWCAALLLCAVRATRAGGGAGAATVDAHVDGVGGAVIPPIFLAYNDASGALAAAGTLCARAAVAPSVAACAHALAGSSGWTPTARRARTRGCPRRWCSRAPLHAPLTRCARSYGSPLLVSDLWARGAVAVAPGGLRGRVVALRGAQEAIPVRSRPRPCVVFAGCPALRRGAAAAYAEAATEADLLCLTDPSLDPRLVMAEAPARLRCRVECVGVVSCVFWWSNLPAADIFRSTLR